MFTVPLWLFTTNVQASFYFPQGSRDQFCQQNIQSVDDVLTVDKPLLNFKFPKVHNFIVFRGENARILSWTILIPGDYFT